MTKTYGKIYSVDEISDRIKKIVENSGLDNIWVKGEISNFRHHDKRHMYFSLKDKNAVIDCAMFKSANKKLIFDPEEGMQVLIRGNVGIYKRRSNYQIIVEEMKPAGGRGELYIKFLQIKEKLEKKGFFNKDKNLPKFPKKIGVVTSGNGAAIEDITTTIERRFPVKILLYPSLVQGKNAKDNIARGIKYLDNTDVDVIIIARGGGSWEDLWPFNEEVVAKAIYNCKKPVISGVGHETDHTIADFVADKRAVTPSGAAEIAVPNKKELNSHLDNLRDSLIKLMKNNLLIKKERLNSLASRTIFKKPLTLIEKKEQQIDDIEKNLSNVLKSRLEKISNEIDKKEGKLNALSPFGVLERGYSITMRENRVIRSVSNLKEGDIITTTLKDGNVNSKVNKNGK